MISLRNPYHPAWSLHAAARGIDPVTIGIASLAMSALSTGAGFIGQQQQQAAQAQAMQQQAAMQGAQANYQAQVARQNQELADRQAADAVARGQVAEDAQRRKTAQAIGTQTAILAAQGTDLSGSPTDILGDTASAGELDAQTIRSNAAREAYGYKIQSTGFGNEGMVQDSRARNSYYSGGTNMLGAGASLLAGASNLAEKWYKFQQSGVESYPNIDSLMKAKGIG